MPPPIAWRSAELLAGVGFALGHTVRFGVGVNVGQIVCFGVGVGQTVCFGVGVGQTVRFGVVVTVEVTVAVAVGVAVAVTVGVAVTVAVSVSVDVAVAVGVSVGVAVGVCVGVTVGVGVGVSVGVGVGVSVGVGVGVGVRTGLQIGWLALTGNSSLPWCEVPLKYWNTARTFAGSMQSEVLSVKCTTYATCREMTRVAPAGLQPNVAGQRSGTPPAGVTSQHSVPSVAAHVPPGHSLAMVHGAPAFVPLQRSGDTGGLPPGHPPTAGRSMHSCPPSKPQDPSGLNESVPS